MTEPYLTDELRMVRETVRRFVDRELIPREMEFPEGDALPDELLRPLQEKAKALDFWLLDVPVEHGGQGLGVLQRCVIAQEIGRTVAIPFRGDELFGPNVGPILLQADASQRERFLEPLLRREKRTCFAQTEPDAGSDPSSMTTRAVRAGDDYVLNGTKRFITGADRADFAQVMAVTDLAKGARGGISCFLVDMATPGVELVGPQRIMTGDETWEIVFDDVRVPVANRVGEEGAGFGLAQGWLTNGRVVNHGARCVGIAKRALELMVSYAAQRVTFGKPLSERQTIQFMVADSAIEIKQAELLVHDTATRLDQGDDVRDESYMTKIVCVETAGRVVDRAIQVHGGMGLTQELPLERWYRQTRSLRITEGATEVMRWRLARNIIRRQGG
jgi:acyl-CoA dehydrogenase